MGAGLLNVADNDRHSPFRTQEINTTDTDIELVGLDANAIYRILVVSRGPYGVSLPSSMLLINTSAAGEPHVREFSD